jgi:hypothetical protein
MTICLTRGAHLAHSSRPALLKSSRWPHLNSFFFCSLTPDPCSLSFLQIISRNLLSCIQMSLQPRPSRRRLSASKSPAHRKSSVFMNLRFKFLKELDFTGNPRPQPLSMGELAEITRGGAEEGLGGQGVIER